MLIRNKLMVRVAVTALACTLLGCPSAKVTEKRSNVANETLFRPSRIIVYDFAATADDVADNAGSSGHYAKHSTPQTPEQIQLGRKLGDRVAQHLVPEILAMGMPAERSGVGPPPGQGDLIIQGEFVSIDKGSRAKRMLIGFGAGAGELQTRVVGYQVTPTGLRQLGEATIKTSGGKMPGVLVPVAGGAAAGSAATSAAVSGGLNVAQEAGPEGLNTAAKNTAKEVAKILSQAFARRGWIASSKAK